MARTLAVKVTNDEVGRWGSLTGQCALILGEAIDDVVDVED